MWASWRRASLETEPGLTMTEAIVKSTCSRDCYDACGLAVYRENGSSPKALGDRINARHLARASSAANAPSPRTAHGAMRGLGSSARCGGPEQKGPGAFLPISWDEALAEIAKRFRAIIDADDARSIVSHSLYRHRGADRRLVSDPPVQPHGRDRGRS